jgi:endogenous inhibitor of DNA gyrase (YacG/DUF329 family)
MATAAPAARRPKPTIRERAAQATCPNCGGAVVRRSARGPFPKFCDARGEGVCKKEHANRHVVEGRAMAALVKAWRIDRGQGEIAQRAFQQVCQMADQFNAADAAYRGPNGETRPRADLYAAKLMADGSMFFDRQNR